MKMDEWADEDDPKLRALFQYQLRTHVRHQDGRDSLAPTLVFADADYEVGDGKCGLHVDAKSANEPAIVFVRADALVDAADSIEDDAKVIEALKAALTDIGEGEPEWPDDSAREWTIKSALGYEYDLKDALRSNPTIVMAGDDICAIALNRIEALEAEVARLREYYEAREAVSEVGLFFATNAMLRRENAARAALAEQEKDDE